MNFSLLEIFEILAIIGVIYLQFSFWTETRAKIRLFKGIIPAVGQFSLAEVNFLANDLKTVDRKSVV